MSVLTTLADLAPYGMLSGGELLRVRPEDFLWTPAGTPHQSRFLAKTALAMVEDPPVRPRRHSPSSRHSCVRKGARRIHYFAADGAACPFER